MTVQLPTVPGCLDGVVGLHPLRLQCRDCGAIYTGTRGPGRVGWDVLLSGYRFHTCEGPTGVRRCPSCRKKVLDACPRDHS